MPLQLQPTAEAAASSSLGGDFVVVVPIRWEQPKVELVLPQTRFQTSPVKLRLVSPIPQHCNRGLRQLWAGRGGASAFTHIGKKGITNHDSHSFFRVPANQQPSFCLNFLGLQGTRPTTLNFKTPNLKILQPKTLNP